MDDPRLVTGDRRLWTRDSLSPVYLIVDQATCGDRPLMEVLGQALEGGVRFVQLREKEMERDALLALAAEVRELTLQVGARLIINSDIEVAVAVKADGLHLPSAQMKLARSAADALPGCLIGASVHSASELADASDAGADFVVFSPVFASSSKPQQGLPVGIDGLRKAVIRATLPVFALSGITPERVPACREAGAAGVAVMSGILGRKDVGKATEEYLKAWNERKGATTEEAK